MQFKGQKRVYVFSLPHKFEPQLLLATTLACSESDIQRLEMEEHVSQPLAPPFINPRNLQEASPLFKLPFELRLKIWRYLFKASHALKSTYQLMITMPEIEDETDSIANSESGSEGDSNNESNENGNEDEKEEQKDDDDEDLLENAFKRRLSHRKVQERYRDCVGLSSQILRTCQVIYAEGLTILYPENTLAIFCDFDSYISLMDVYIRAESKLEQLSRHNLSLLDYPYHKASDSTRQPNIWSGKLRQICPWLTGFGHYQITMHAIEGGEFDYPDPIQVPFRILADLLKDQKVSIIFENSGRRLLAKDISSLQISACYLRCKTIHFEGPMTPKLKRLQRLITGKSRPTDFVEICRRVKKCLRVQVNNYVIHWPEFSTFFKEIESLLQSGSWMVGDADGLKQYLLKMFMMNNEIMMRSKFEKVEEEKKKKDQELNRILTSAFGF